MWLAGLILGLYLVARAIIELFVIDLSDPTTYREGVTGFVELR
jgi:hypothetical protein